MNALFKANLLSFFIPVQGETDNYEVEVLFDGILDAINRELQRNSWGFEYKTAAFVWVKKNKKSNTNFWGMGAYTRANAEVCLLGISKRTMAAKQVKQHNIHQIIEHPVEQHSKKPDIVRNKIIELLGDLPRIELFARQKTEGWDVWGNEVESDIKL